MFVSYALNTVVFFSQHGVYGNVQQSYNNCKPLLENDHELTVFQQMLDASYLVAFGCLANNAHPLVEVECMERISHFPRSVAGDDAFLPAGEHHILPAVSLCLLCAGLPVGTSSPTAYQKHTQRHKCMCSVHISKQSRYSMGSEICWNHAQDVWHCLSLALFRQLSTDSNFSSIFTRFRDIAAFVIQHATPPLISPKFPHVPIAPDRPCWCQPEQRP